MNTQQIKHLIADEKAKINEEELFSSPSYRAYLQNIADNVSGKYGRGAFVQVVYRTDVEETANTDNFKININTANILARSFKKTAHKNLSNIGLIGHECGHILFTDFHCIEKYQQAILNGKFYPRKPVAKNFRSKDHKNNLAEITAIFDEKNPLKLKILSKIAVYLSNVVEDGYIERLMKAKFPGSISIGIQLNNIKQAEIMPSLKDMVDNEYQPMSIIANLLLQYVKTGRIENDDDLENEYTEILTDCLQTLYFAIDETNPKERFSAINHLLVYCWNFIKPLLDEIDEDKNKTDDNSSEDSSSDNGNSSENSLSQNKADEIMSELENELFSSSEMSENMHTIGLEAEESEILDGEQERMKREQTEIENMISSDDGMVNFDNEYISRIVDNELENILNGFAEKKVFSALEDSLSDSLIDEAKQIDYGNIHKNAHVNIHRQKYLNGNEVELYNKAMLELRPVSKMLKKSVLNVIKQRQRGFTERGLYMGNRLDHTAFYRNDGKIFTKRNRPNDEIELAVGVLVDMLGSMSGERIRMAQAMALIVHDFCQSLHIPVTVYGHDSSGRDVDLYSFVEFDSVDGRDKYRIMNMRAGGCNRDGCAVRYVAEKLMKRNEATKLFIIVSDGQPAANEYCGTGAEQDLRNIRKEYVAKGITFIAAAIGSDKEAIKRCYGEQCFLDITDLKQFPITITKLIAKYAIE